MWTVKEYGSSLQYRPFVLKQIPLDVDVTKYIDELVSNNAMEWGLTYKKGLNDAPRKSVEPLQRKHVKLDSNQIEWIPSASVKLWARESVVEYLE